MQARLVAYVPDGAAIARIVAPGERLRIGRAPDAGLVLAHASVSRAHAELEYGDDGWTLADLGSKNGTFLDGARVGRASLANGGWLRFGDVHCELSLLDAGAAEDQARRWQERRAQATRLTERIDALARPAEGAVPTPALLEQSLRAVLELAQCSRGFVLVTEGGGHRIAASIALDASLATGTEFTGSLGAVAQALRTHEPVVYNDVLPDLQLSSRESVVHGGLRTLVALPLLDGDRALGAIYADRREAGPPLTTLDLELLQAFAERCALWLAARGEAQADAPRPRASAPGPAPTR